MDSLARHIAQPYSFVLFGLVVLITILMAAATQAAYWLALPFGIITALFIFFDLRRAYYLLLLFVPLSIEYSFNEHLATDLPDEPLIIALMLGGMLYFAVKQNVFANGFWGSSLVQILIAHWIWIGLTVFFSAYWPVSLKFWAAKTWYIIVFFFLSASFLRTAQAFRNVIWCLTIPVAAVALRTLYIHALNGFSFAEANHVMHPFFRNHVNYAVMMAALLPYLWYAKNMLPKGSTKKRWANFMLWTLIIGILFAYTRAAYLALFAVPFMYLIFKLRLSNAVFLASLIGLLGIVVYLGSDSRYLDLAPDYEHTIFHEDFGDHLSATFEGRDMSFMERIYRWVAAINMSIDRPWTGFGPNNFFNYYKQYTYPSFETYVSDNPEKSGVHNYFLMTLVEQGVIGLCLFVGIIIAFFNKGEQLYQRLAARNSNDRHLVMAIMCSMGIIVINSLVGDLIETDKIGSLFFINIAVLINTDIRTQNG